MSTGRHRAPSTTPIGTLLGAAGAAFSLAAVGLMASAVDSAMNDGDGTLPGVTIPDRVVDEVLDTG
ncbi:hypothetical protein [Streptomyces alboflavus]|uniref:hypothetical protein n=1 Tax=Streptomyces alboflavus TaxID=67267 RepID=UPI000F657767|nr:hypothetical protein [Streptomyces alboflavus]